MFYICCKYFGVLHGAANLETLFFNTCVWVMVIIFPLSLLLFSEGFEKYINRSSDSSDVFFLDTVFYGLYLVKRIDKSLNSTTFFYSHVISLLSAHWWVHNTCSDTMTQ